MPVVAIKELRALLPPRARLMGIDHGTKRIGLAVSNPELTIASALAVLQRGKLTENIGALAKHAAEYGVRGFVIGLPLNMDGTEGPRCESVRHFGKHLIEHQMLFGFDPLVAYWDERLSSHAVEDFLAEQGIRRDKRAGLVDKLAAQMILQGVLDARL